MVLTGPPRSCAGPGAKISKGPQKRQNCKRGEAVFYNILRFITYYPTLTLAFIFSVKPAILYQGVLRLFVALGALLSWGPGAMCPPPVNPWKDPGPFPQEYFEF